MKSVQGLLNRLTGKARVHEVPVDPTPRTIDPGVTAISFLRRRNGKPIRRGVWVRYKAHTGILMNLEPGDIATVMITTEGDGLNSIEVHCPASELRQAFYEEIPAKRRPDYETAARLGYVRVP